LSFAQFEREIISERTRDKIAATRRKGKWTGGRPLLGYDVDPRGGKLHVNADEAECVRAIFRIYLEHESLQPVLQELDRRAWTNKRWTGRDGRQHGGMAFAKTSLYRLLSNIAYTGQVRYKDEIHAGEHTAIVDPAMFQKVQVLLRRNSATRGAPVRNKFGALLKGLLHCAPCGCAMTPAHSTQRGRRYRYYVCVNAQKRGWNRCPSKSIPAGEVEQFVVEQVRCIGRDEDLRREVLAQVTRQQEERTVELAAEQRGLEKSLTAWHTEVGNLALQVRPSDDNGAVVGRLAELHERIGLVEGRVQKVREQIKAVSATLVDETAAAETFALFDPLWRALTPAEQGRVLGLLVERVVYDGGAGKVAVTFHPTGIKALADELAGRREEQCA
jgi:site-specific DNA recombinase